MASAKTLVVAAFYLCALANYTYSLWYDLMYVNIGNSTFLTYQGFAGKLKFLTFWCQCLQTFYFSVCVMTVFAGYSVSSASSPCKPSGLLKFRDIFHCALAFPVGSFVVITFWALYAVDRELVYPKVLDTVIPTWLNHSLHTFVLPLLLVEKYLVYHHHPQRRNGICILAAFALTYLAWILWVAYHANLWVYPVLRIMENHERAVFIMFLMLFFISIYLVGESLTRLIWRKEGTAVSTTTTKKLK